MIKMNKKRWNKKGWIRIVEAFVAILLITGVLLITINKGFFRKDIAEKVYEIQASILREIELNNELRNKILNAKDDGATLEVDIESHKSDGTLNLGNRAGQFPAEVWNRIDQRISQSISLECRAKICDLNWMCGLSKYPGKNIYVQSVAISATIDQTNPNLKPRQLKLFCWEKG